jgi:transcriptional regulator GlxA family with amidase domain
MVSMAETRVVALAMDGVITFDLGIAVQMFGRGAGIEPDGFTLTVCTPRPGRVNSPDGFGLHVEHGLSALKRADIVYLPGHYPMEAPTEVIEALRTAHSRGARMLSVCIGAFLLGRAGLLDGHTATTHWAFADEFRAAFPAVNLRPDLLYVDDGDVLTSAGLAAGLDLCLHVVREQLGAAHAASLACFNVVAPHRDGGQAQFIPSPVTALNPGGLASTLQWALEHLDEPLDTAALAAHAGLSPRTLARRFAEELGQPPGRWLTRQRISRARALLETTTLSVEEVAGQVGFGSAATLRVHLRRAATTTPTAYRRTFAPAPDRSQLTG